MLKPTYPMQIKGRTFNGRHKRFVKRNKINNKNIKSSYSLGKKNNNKNIKSFYSLKKNKNFMNKNRRIDENKILKDLYKEKKITKDPLLVTKKCKKNIKSEVNNYFKKFAIN